LLPGPLDTSRYALYISGVNRSDDLFRMNVDKGQQSNGGDNALVLGDMANSQSCGSEPPRWELKRLSGSALQITTDETGRVWPFVGTDSGFESRTEVYDTRFSARFDPA